MKVAIYVRVSTEEQAKEGYSISAQKKRLQAYCLSQGWETVGFYVDEGISAKDMERPELKRMIKHIENGVIDCVLVYKLDRLTRSVLDLYKLLEIFEKYNTKFKSATEVYDTTTAMGRMFITIVAALAQWERENLGERVRFGMTEKARQGKWVASLPPYGYDRAGDDLLVNESEAAVVRQIFTWYIDGLGMNKIAGELNIKGIATKSGSEWSSNKVNYVLGNPIYVGTMRWNYRVNQEHYFEVEGAFPAIIEPDVYEQAQRIKQARSVKHPKAATSDFIFSGIAKCARCGAPLAGKYGYSKRGEKIHRPRSYYCTNQKRKTCDLPNMSERFIERHFLNYIGEWDISEQAAAHTDSDYSDDMAQEREKIEKELQAIEKRKKKWQYAWVNDMITDEEFTNLKKEEQEKEKLLQAQLEQLNPIQPVELNELELISMLSDLRSNWEYLTPQEKKNFLGIFVKKMTVDKISTAPKFESVQLVEMEFY